LTPQKPHITTTTTNSLSSGVTTCGQALYQSLGLPLPPSSPLSKTIFIYGGSSATGGLAIQYAKLSGYKVITSCSPHNFDYVKNVGAGMHASSSIPFISLSFHSKK
jgi:NADPH:quinone reductase-like Zn-dependent oxidoreductase